MDPITIIVTALVAGAAAGLKPAAETAVKDAYAGIKALIQRKYGDVGLVALEKKPESEAKQASVSEDLTDAGAGDDAELLEQAKALLDTIKQHERQTAEAIGVDFGEGGDFSRATIRRVAGRDIRRGPAAAEESPGGKTPGVDFGKKGQFRDAEIEDIAGRDIVED